MSYDEEIEKTGIREHPLTAFQNMGSLSEGDDFATEFAGLLDILSKNIVIPVELIDENADAFDEYEGETKEDVLKEWAAEHAQGERVYAEIDGELNIAEVPDNASGPDDVGLEGVGSGGESSVPDRAQYTSDSEILDVENHNRTAEFILRSTNGGGAWAEFLDLDAGDDDTTETYTSNHGLGKIVRVSIDLSNFETLYARFYSGESGNDYGGQYNYSKGESQVTFEDGGVGVAIVDGDENIVVGVSGGSSAVAGTATHSTDTYGDLRNNDYYTPNVPAGGLSDEVAGGNSTSAEMDHYDSWTRSSANLTGSPNDGDVNAPSIHASVDDENPNDDKDALIQSFVG